MTAVRVRATCIAATRFFPVADSSKMANGVEILSLAVKFNDKVAHEPG